MGRCDPIVGVGIIASFGKGTEDEATADYGDGGDEGVGTPV